MKRIRIVSACLVAAFVLSAAVATAAQAEFPAVFPAFAKCVKLSTKTGRFTEKNCQKAAAGNTGTWELQSAVGTKLKSSTLVSTLVTKGVGTVKCTSGTDEGEITGEQTGTDVVTFNNCETLGKKCTSAGQAEGTIKTFELDTTIGFLSKEKNQVGVSLTGAGPEGLSAEFNCGGSFLVKTGGAVIGAVTGNINKSSVKSSETFKEVAGKQSPLKFEGGLEERLMSEFVSAEPGVKFPSNEVTKATETTTEAGEILTKL